MNESREGTKATAKGSTASTAGIGATLLRVAWLAILLGVVMEGLLRLLAAGFGGLPGVEDIAPDLLAQISWTTIVCVGLALGTAVSKARAPLMGLLGLFAAPIAFDVSRALHQGLYQALHVTHTASAGGPLFLIALVKAVEYGCLGAVLGWVGQRPWGGAMTHVAVGLAVGIVFGSVIVGLLYSASPEPPPSTALISRALNEVIFPVGCSLVLFSATVLGKRAAE
jgi:hypothetical protein